MNFAELPKNTDVANKVVEATAADNAARVERGWLGVIFGGRKSVPNNIAGLTVIVGAVLLCFVLALGNDDAKFGRKDLAALCMSLITLALGFLFGRATRD